MLHVLGPEAEFSVPNHQFGQTEVPILAVVEKMNPRRREQQPARGCRSEASIGYPRSTTSDRAENLPQLLQGDAERGPPTCRERRATESSAEPHTGHPLPTLSRDFRSHCSQR